MSSHFHTFIFMLAAYNLPHIMVPDMGWKLSPRWSLSMRRQRPWPSTLRHRQGSLRNSETLMILPVTAGDQLHLMTINQYRYYVAGRGQAGLCTPGPAGGYGQELHHCPHHQTDHLRHVLRQAQRFPLAHYRHRHLFFVPVFVTRSLLFPEIKSILGEQRGVRILSNAVVALVSIS